MVSRREFLGTSLTGLSWPATRKVASATPSDAELDRQVVLRDYWNDWPKYLSSQVSEARARRKATLAAILSPSQVRERSEFVRKKVYELIGGPMERTPLNAQTVGSLTRGHYRIDKIIFESQPQFYVTANLYVPLAGTLPYPAVISPLGHYSEGKAARNYQFLFQNLARKGYVVLTYDPIGQGEREQFLDPSRMHSRLAGPVYEHDRAGIPMWLLGDDLALYEIWDAFRAVDYLQSRPEVDSSRIGCAGHSGGGVLTMFLCALESRIQAAVAVEGHFRNFGHAHFDPPCAIGDVEQNITGDLAAGIDRGDLLFAFAPKPLLICYTLMDGINWTFAEYPECVREIFEEAQSAYTLMGEKERIKLFRSPLPHNYDFFNRRETYAWLNRWLAKEDLGTDEAPFDILPAEALNCTSTGQVRTSRGGRSIVQVNTDRMQTFLNASGLHTSEIEPSAFRASILSRLQEFLRLPRGRHPLQSQELSSGSQTDVVIEEFEFHSEEEIRIPGWFVKPKGARGSLPTVLYLTEGSKNDAVNEPSELQELARQGFALCAVDLRGLGAAAPRFPITTDTYNVKFVQLNYSKAGLMIDRPVVGQRVWDFMRCLDYLEARPDVDKSRMYVCGVAGGGIVALLGAALDDRPRSILCENTLATYRSVVESQEYSWGLPWFVPGILRHFDLPEVAACVAPRGIWLLNAESGQAKPLPNSDLGQSFAVTQKLYSVLNASEKFRLVIEPAKSRISVALEWLRNS